MNWLSYLKFVPLIAQAVPAVQKAFNTSARNSESKVSGVVQELIPALVPILEGVAKDLFPNLGTEIHLAAGALIAFHPDATEWLQDALNHVDNAGLDVDGEYGPLTRGAVEAFQSKHGLAVTGWASDAENAALTLLLSKM